MPRPEYESIFENCRAPGMIANTRGVTFRTFVHDQGFDYPDIKTDCEYIATMLTVWASPGKCEGGNATLKRKT